MSTNPLGKMIGPYPLGVWLGVVAGGLGIAYVLQRGDRAGQAQAEAEAGAATVWPQIGIPGGPVVYYDGASDDPNDDDGLSNTEWARLTAPKLAALTGRGPTSVQAALINYINGEETDCGIVNAALGAGWYPPELVPAPVCSSGSGYVSGLVDIYGTPVTGPHHKDAVGTPTGGGTGFAGLINGLGKQLRDGINAPALPVARTAPVDNTGGYRAGGPTRQRVPS